MAPSSLAFECKWEPRDCWVGLFWDQRTSETGEVTRHVYICPLPTLLLHWSWRRYAE